MTALVLLARQLRRSGCTTEAIALRLSVSRRHVRRLLSAYRRLARQRLTMTVEQDLREDFERLESYLSQVDATRLLTTDPAAIARLIRTGDKLLRTKNSILVDLHIRRPMGQKLVDIPTLERAKGMSTEAVLEELAQRARIVGETISTLPSRPLE